MPKYTHHISISRESIWEKKFQRFKKRSLFLYAIAALLICLVNPYLFGNWVLTYALSFGVFTLLGYVALHIGTQLQSKILCFSGQVHFEDGGLDLEHEYESEKSVSIPWTDVREIMIGSSNVAIDLGKQAPHFIILKRAEMSDLEIEFLKEKK